MEFWKSPGKIVGVNLVRLDRTAEVKNFYWLKFKGKYDYANIGLNLLLKMSIIFYSVAKLTVTKSADFGFIPLLPLLRVHFCRKVEIVAFDTDKKTMTIHIKLTLGSIS